MSFVNLLPQDYLARQAQRRANLMCLVLFGAVMAGVLWAAHLSERGVAKTREVYDRVNQSYLDAAKLIDQMQELEKVKQRMLDKAKLTAGLLERVPRSFLLATITNALPSGGSLRDLGLSTKRQEVVIAPKSGEAKSRFEQSAARAKAEATRSERTDVSIAITGLAATDVEVGKFISAMDRCPLVESVDLVYSQEKKYEQVLVREFKVILHLKVDADVLGDPSDLAESLARAEPVRRQGEQR